MTRHIDHIVCTAQDEKVTVFVFDTPVKSGVNHLAGYCGPVGFDETIIVTPHGLQATGWQGTFNGNHTFLVGLREFFTRLIVQQFDVIAIDRFAR